MSAAEKVPVRRALHLLSPLDSFPQVRIFIVGEDDVTSIKEGAAGSYDVHIGPKLVNVPSHKIDHYEQDPRPGYEQERKNGERELPSYALPIGDGTFGCLRCSRRDFPSVHAVKVHFGIQHGDERT